MGGFQNLEGRPLAESPRQLVDRFLEYAIRFAALNLVGPDLMDQVLHRVAEMQRVEHAHPEIDGELQARLAGRGFYAFLLLEKQNAEAVEAGILQRVSVFRLIHAEAAWSAGAGGKEDIVIDNVLAGDALLLQSLQILD